MLMFVMYIVDQNGRVLIAKYIEVEPYPGVRFFSNKIFSNKKWWVMRGSNPRPSRCKRDALAN